MHQSGPALLRQFPVDARRPEGPFVKERSVSLDQGCPGIQPVLDILRCFHAPHCHQGKGVAGDILEPAQHIKGTLLQRGATCPSL